MLESSLWSFSFELGQGGPPPPGARALGGEQSWCVFWYWKQSSREREKSEIPEKNKVQLSRGEKNLKAGWTSKQGASPLLSPSNRMQKPKNPLRMRVCYVCLCPWGFFFSPLRLSLKAQKGVYILISVHSAVIGNTISSHPKTELSRRSQKSVQIKTA